MIPVRKPKLIVGGCNVHIYLWFPQIYSQFRGCGCVFLFPGKNIHQVNKYFVELQWPVNASTSRKGEAPSELSSELIFTSATGNRSSEELRAARPSSPNSLLPAFISWKQWGNTVWMMTLWGAVHALWSIIQSHKSQCKNSLFVVYICWHCVFHVLFHSFLWQILPSHE